MSIEVDGNTIATTESGFLENPVTGLSLSPRQWPTPKNWN